MTRFVGTFALESADSYKIAADDHRLRQSSAKQVID